MNRRNLLQGLSGLALATMITPEIAQAAGQLAQGAAAGLDWRLGFADLDADLAPAAMRRVSGRAPPGPGRRPLPQRPRQVPSPGRLGGPLVRRRRPDARLPHP